jgi:hypothetical protein
MEFLQKGGTLTQKLFNSPDIKTWADLKIAFLEEFEPNNSIKLYTTEQGPDEPGFTFLFRVLNLLNEQFQEWSKGSDIIELLIEKLNTKYKSRVKKERPKNLKELKEILKVIDRGVEPRQAKSKKGNAVKNRLCYKCRKKGHLARECTFVKKHKTKKH